MKPGEYLLKDDEILANNGRKTTTILVKNTGDRPIQVGSHYHFFEVNRGLEFRSSRRLWYAPEHCRRDRCALRAGRGERSESGCLWRLTYCLRS